jgi:hypothetical protein
MRNDQAGKGGSVKRKDKGRLWWWISILVIALAGILAGYFLGMEQGRKEAEKPPVEKAPPPKKEAPPEQAPVAKGPVVIRTPRNSNPLTRRRIASAWNRRSRSISDI